MARGVNVWVLRRLFLKLVVRGPTADGLPPESRHRSLFAKVAADGLFYAVGGTTALVFLSSPLASLALYLHAGTMVLVGLFLASAVGDVLGSRQEALVFSTRPVALRTVIWAKALVLAEIALWLGGAFNLTGLALGSFGANGTPLFALAHLVSSALNVLFCVGCALIFHELRLAWRLSRTATRRVLALGLLAALVALGVGLGR